MRPTKALGQHILTCCAGWFKCRYSSAATRAMTGASWNSLLCTCPFSQMLPCSGPWSWAAAAAWNSPCSDKLEDHRADMRQEATGSETGGSLQACNTNMPLAVAPYTAVASGRHTNRCCTISTSSALQFQQQGAQRGGNASGVIPTHTRFLTYSSYLLHKFSDWHDECYAKVKGVLHNFQFTREAVTAVNVSKWSWFPGGWVYKPGHDQQFLPQGSPVQEKDPGSQQTPPLCSSKTLHAACKFHNLYSPHACSPHLPSLATGNSKCIPPQHTA